MQLITCPTELPATDAVRIFLGGGISNCPDWQQQAIDLLKHTDYVIINPRRDAFDLADPAASAFQIEWEHRMLTMSDIVLFWFPQETLCPITLYELGRYAALGKYLSVGTHPGYARKFDVKHQLSLVRPEVTVFDTLEDVITQATKLAFTKQTITSKM